MTTTTAHLQHICPWKLTQHQQYRCSVGSLLLGVDVL